MLMNTHLKQSTMYSAQYFNCKQHDAYRVHKNLHALAKKDADKISINTRMSINTNHRYMSKPHMVNEITLLRATIRENEKKIEHLEKMIKEDNRYTTLDETTHQDRLCKKTIMI